MAELARQIAASIDNEPERWSYRTIWLERDDGVKLEVFKPFEGRRLNYVKLDDPSRGSPQFGWWDARLIQAAYSRWQLRPLKNEVCHDH